MPFLSNTNLAITLYRSPSIGASVTSVAWRDPEATNQIIQAVFYYALQKTRYRVNVQTRQCEKRTLNDTFRPIGVPDYAKYLDTMEIGSNAVPAAGVQVTLWAGDNPGTY